jgi:hypothetical protein
MLSLQDSLPLYSGFGCWLRCVGWQCMARGGAVLLQSKASFLWRARRAGGGGGGRPHRFPGGGAAMGGRGGILDRLPSKGGKGVSGRGAVLRATGYSARESPSSILMHPTPPASSPSLFYRLFGKVFHRCSNSATPFFYLVACLSHV